MPSCDEIESKLGWHVLGSSWPSMEAPDFEGIVIEEEPSKNRVRVKSVRSATVLLAPEWTFRYIRKLTNEELLTHRSKSIRELGVKLSKEV